MDTFFGFFLLTFCVGHAKYHYLFHDTNYWYRFQKSGIGAPLVLDSDEYDFRYCLGVAEQTQSVHLEDKDQIVTHLANHFAIFQVKGELDQILCGLSETLDSLQLIGSNPAVMRPLFVPSENPPLSADDIYDIFTISYSPTGSNAREQEEAIRLHWYNFLQRVEG